MKAKRLLVVSMLVGLAGLIGGCHEFAHDDYRDYGNYGYRSYGNYRDGFRDGRAYERQRDNGYYNRGYYGSRW
jgi:hypothetical protein